ncbi:MAG: pyrroloquinoline quinone biosynthesis protein PqqB [Flavobacteriaceae bacterium]|nr:pyrroloquinoline quinone biosynthesis protein PqqB [Flavobacteriaceae bacterium]
MKTLHFLLFIGIVHIAEAQTLVVLGTLQDGGSPHMGCVKDCCATERPNDYVVSLGVIDESKHLLFDASPDIVEQTNYLQSISPAKELEIFLTHAHMGHYAGLIHLGKESANTNQIPVYAMPRMVQFLQNNGPWSQLIDLENISIQPIQNKTPVFVSPRLKVTPLVVPHRDEFSETVGYLIVGQSKRALYVPDIDKWDLWDIDINTLVTQVDYAFIDATFFEDGEIPRPMSEVPHPFVEESITRFKSLAIEEKNKIYFIHLNHTNPARDPFYEGRIAIEKQGYHFATFGMRFSLE